MTFVKTNCSQIVFKLVKESQILPLDILLGRVILNTEQKVKESQSQRDEAFFGKGGIIRGDFRFDCQLPAGEFGGDGRWCAGGPAQ